ncbi:HupE / UreJ protein [bacterium YEK0313]|nr:HupE / UreJ protein [bacterium YEK0313]
MKPTSPFLTFLVAVMMTTAAEAHTGIGSTSAFAAGLVHPLTGLDHMLAMVAVGLWAGMRGGPALWVWPATFVGVMVIGGVLGMAGIGLPFVEQGILASVLLLGLAVALAARPSLGAGAALIGLAALFHGHAHGVEVPTNASGIGYALGFAVATAALHAVGVGVTVLAARLATPVAVRAAGGLTAIAGLVLAVSSRLA